MWFFSVFGHCSLLYRIVFSGIIKINCFSFVINIFFCGVLILLFLFYPSAARLIELGCKSKCNLLFFFFCFSSSSLRKLIKIFNVNSAIVIMITSVTEIHVVSLLFFL